MMHWQDAVASLHVAVSFLVLTYKAPKSESRAVSVHSFGHSLTIDIKMGSVVLRGSRHINKQLLEWTPTHFCT